MIARFGTVGGGPTPLMRRSGVRAPHISADFKIVASVGNRERTPPVHACFIGGFSFLVTGLYHS